MQHEPTTAPEYRAFQQAHDFFNAELFGGTLCAGRPLQRHAKMRGYFSPERFSGRIQAETTAHELAMSPDSLTGHTDEEILSTLAHEMVHAWQQTYGSPPRRSYHDQEWAAKMKEIGLQPTDTDMPGGKETGQRVSHYIIRGGHYAKAYAKLEASGFRLRWQSAPESKQAKAKRASKTKFTCPECGQNAWAKPDVLLLGSVANVNGVNVDE